MHFYKSLYTVKYSLHSFHTRFNKREGLFREQQVKHHMSHLQPLWGAAEVLAVHLGVLKSQHLHFQCHKIQTAVSLPHGRRWSPGS